MANKKAEVGEKMFDIIVYLVLTLLVFSLAYASLSMHRDGTAVWQEYYAHEVRKAIELSQPGDEIVLDVQGAVKIAGKNKFSDFAKMFNYNNDRREICTQFSANGKTCIYYFNNVSLLGMRTDVIGSTALLFINIKPN